MLGGRRIRARVETRRPYDIDSLTDVALAVFAERGYDGASMDDVARAAGITKASIYHHVTGKEALLERGLKRALDALFAILDEGDARSGYAVDRLRYIVRRVSQTTLQLLPELTVLFRVRGASAIQRDAIERRRSFDRITTELIILAQREGGVRDDCDARLLSRLIFGMSNSVVEWYRIGRMTPGQDIASTLESVLFEGLVVPKA